ncbi:MAG: carboxypeptidase regulatory-like domain-containing protein, partial [Anaerolineales bacterium]|nr:carboxypeptidase regulatory-like domain-containing protein [Anaerolineales bacterium]
HADGSLVFNWCPSLPRVSTPATVSVAPPAVSAEIGVPRGTRNLSVVMSTPGNEEHWYASGEMISLVLVNGRVEYTGRLSDLTVRLEIWSGSERLDELSTPAAADGSFTFGINLNPEGSLLVLPIDLLDCLPCHDRDRELATIVLSGSNYTDVSLSGRVRLAIVATTPEGDHATDERWINVDRSRDLTVPVLTFLDGNAAQPIHDLRVEASTVLYEWRARVFAATTDGTGAASVPLEALAEVPTRYTFRVPPTVVDGVRYESIAPVEITLPAGAASAEPVVLAVRAQTGAVTGRLTGAVPLLDAGLPVHAIRLPEGAAFRTQTEAGGVFAFADMPVDQYLIVADTAALAGQGLSGAAQTIDLAQAPQTEVVVALSPLDGHTLEGVVLDSQGEPLPFAWLSVGEAGPSRPVSPGPGAWSLRGVAPDSRSVVAVAPGYYSQARALPDEVGQAGTLDFRLVEGPGLQRLAWGSGELRVPPETQATLEGKHIRLVSGWLWGTGDGDQSGTIETAGVVIEVPGGLFALENQPGQSAWLYLFQGTAEAYRAADPSRRAYLAAGEMLALTASGALAAAPLDPAVMQALHPSARAPLPAVWEPNLAAQVRDRLALLGVTTAQVVTFATYSLSIAALVTLPVAGAMWWRRRARLAHPSA